MFPTEIIMKLDANFFVLLSECKFKVLGLPRQARISLQKKRQCQIFAHKKKTLSVFIDDCSV